MNQLDGKQQFLRQRLFQHITIDQYLFRLQEVFPAGRGGQQDELTDEPARTCGFDNIQTRLIRKLQID
ncbi:hypothetical protein D3C81_1986700 [compost metagenome]